MDQVRSGEWFYGKRAATAAPVELAHADAFDLADLKVEPALCRLSARGQCERVEPRVMQLLVALARAEGAILSRDDLIDACWDGRVVSDDAVNRVVSRLRKALAELDGAAVAIETIPRVGYRLAVNGEVGATPAVERAPLGLPHWRAAAAVAAMLGAAGLLWAASPFASRAKAAATISIQPVPGGARTSEEARFVNVLTSDFGRAAEAISGVNLVDAQAPRAEPSSDYIVRISVDRERGGLAAQARLVSGSDGSVLWSREFSDTRRNYSALREQVAVAAAGVLRCGLERTAPAVRDDPATARLFFAACDAAQIADWATATSFARQVVARRPDVAAGWACLAMTSLWSASSQTGLPRAERLRVRAAAQRYAEKAIGLDPHSGRAYIALSLVQSDRGAYSSQLSTLEQGLKADPELTDLLTAYSGALFDAGYVADSVAPALRALALNPMSRKVGSFAVGRLLAAGRTDEAFAALATLEKNWADHPEVFAQRIWLTGMYGDPRQALALIDRHTREIGHPPRLLPFTPETIAWRADPASLDRRRLDRDAEAQFARDPASAWFTATAMNRMGESARATAWLRRAPVSEAYSQWSTLFWPDAAPLRRDPRAFAAMARIGLVDLWRQRGKWPDFCSDPGLPYDCRDEARKYPPRSTTT